MPIYEFLRAKAVTGYGKLGKIPRALPARAATFGQEEAALSPATANEGILVWVGGQLLPRHMAKVCIYLYILLSPDVERPPSRLVAHSGARYEISDLREIYRAARRNSAGSSGGCSSGGGPQSAPWCTI